MRIVERVIQQETNHIGAREIQAGALHGLDTRLEALDKNRW
jgi:hypothetical protein